MGPKRVRRRVGSAGPRWCRERRVTGGKLLVTQLPPTPHDPRGAGQSKGVGRSTAIRNHPEDRIVNRGLGFYFSAKFKF